MRALRKRWQLGVVVVCGLVVCGGTTYALHAARNAARAEAAWLRGRLADKRDVIRGLQADLAMVAEASERVSQMASMARERNAQARRLAGLEEPRDEVYTPARIAMLDQVTVERSEEAGRALIRLGFVEEQLAATTDSMALMMVVGKPPGRVEPCPQAPAVDVRTTPRVVKAALPAPRTVAKAAPVVARAPSMPGGWPVQGEVSSGYGWRESPYGGGVRRHTGVDIRAPHGSPVLTSGAGTVVFAGRDSGGYGNTVVIDHGRDVKTLYGHLAGIYVRLGQRVARGTTIGAVGATGRATGVHLHYEVRVDDEPVDPVTYLRGPRTAEVALASPRGR